MIATMVSGLNPYFWRFVSHSIPFVFSQRNPSLGLSLGAPIAEPKSGSTGWVGLFGGSAGAVAGAGGVGFGAISAIFSFENPGSLNRIPPIFISVLILVLVLVLHLSSKLGGGLPHSNLSMSDRLYGNQLNHIFHPASSEKNIAAPQSRGVNSTLQMLCPA